MSVIALFAVVLMAICLVGALVALLSMPTSATDMRDRALAIRASLGVLVMMGALTWGCARCAGLVP